MLIPRHDNPVVLFAILVSLIDSKISQYMLNNQMFSLNAYSTDKVNTQLEYFTR